MKLIWTESGPQIIYVCRGQSGKKNLLKNEMLDINDELGKTRTLLAKAMAEADEVDNELKAEAATHSGACALHATFQNKDNRSYLLVPIPMAR